jgi:hypothetical protein
MKGRLASKRAIVSLALVGVMAAVGVGYASIPNTGVISGCYLKSGGTLRVIDATTGSCSSKETALSWNVQGVPGPKGDTGDKGLQGDTGPAGLGFQAYAHVNADATLDAARSKNVTNVAHVSRTGVDGNSERIAGTYCLQTNFSPNVVNVTLDTPSDLAASPIVEVHLGGPGERLLPASCPDGTTATVEIFTPNGNQGAGVFENSSFFVVLG